MNETVNKLGKGYHYNYSDKHFKFIPQVAARDVLADRLNWTILILGSGRITG